MIRWPRRDRPDRPLMEQMRELFGVPADWTHKPTARRVPNRKPRTIEEWKRDNAKRSA